MATRKTRLTAIRRPIRPGKLDFAALEIVGAPLTPDMVAKIASFEAGQQTKDGYGIPLGLDLRDEIARYYRIGEVLWNRFRSAPQQTTPFVTDLLKQCFGFDSLANQPPHRHRRPPVPRRPRRSRRSRPIVIAPPESASNKSHILTAVTPVSSSLTSELAAPSKGPPRSAASSFAVSTPNGRVTSAWVRCNHPPLRAPPGR